MTDTRSNSAQPAADANHTLRFSLAAVPVIGFREIVRRLRKFNFYRILREKAVRWYLKRMTACPARGLVISWQPLYFIICKTAVVVSLSLLLLSAFPYLAGWLKAGLAFFRLHEIYNFKFPEDGFFNDLARGLLLAVIGYYGIFFAVHQLAALFSYFAVSVPGRKAYFVKSYFFKKDLHVIALPALDYFSLKHNLLFRLLGLGTIVMKNRSGERLTIRSVTRAARIMKTMAAAKTGKSTAARSRLRDPWDDH